MIVIKSVISLGIIFLSAYIGILKSSSLKNREYILRDMISFLKLLKNEIRYMLVILPNAYEISRQNLNTTLKDSIGQIVVDMLKYDDYSKVEKSIVENITKINEITEYDKSVIISVLKSLGSGDVETQINIIDNSITILENQVKEANEIKLKNTKVYKMIGTCAGIMIVIIFI